MFYDKTFPVETHSARLPNRSGAHNRPTSDSTEVELDESMTFIGIIYRNMGEGLLTGAEMTQRLMHHLSPPQPLGQFTTTGKPEA